MSEHSVLDCSSREWAIFQAHVEVGELRGDLTKTYSFEGEGLPDSTEEYLRRKTEVLHTFMQANFDYLVGLIWEAEQRRKGER